MSAKRTVSEPISRRTRERHLLSVRPPPAMSLHIREEQWEVFRRAIVSARSADVHFALGGGLAASFYTGVWRTHKDLDLYIVPSQRERMIEAMERAGLSDYFEVCSYDRRWIHRSHDDGTIVDVMWALANHRAQVDEDWLTQGPAVDLFGEKLHLVAAEELIFSKIHVLQKERSDWPDIINMLYATGPQLDWDRLLARVRGEERLLSSVLLLFSWLAPGRAEAFPEWIWHRLEIPSPEIGPLKAQDRIDSLDSRPWFIGDVG